MAITTVDKALAGMQPFQMLTKLLGGPGAGRLFSTWGIAGIPGAGSFNTTLAGGTYSSTGGLVAGQIPHFDPGGGISSYLARFVATNSNNTISGAALLLDRLWDNG